MNAAAKNSTPAIKIKVAGFNTGGTWVEGSHKGYIFFALIFDEASEYGIKKGRVSKLSMSANGCTFVRYDRMWEMKPKGEEQTQAYDEILAAVEAFKLK